MENNKEIGIAKAGMNRNTHPSELDVTQYTFALNSNVESAEGNSFNLTNERSTLLCSKFKPNYKVIGTLSDPSSDRTYFFLTNPTTSVSEIGYIDGINFITDLSDIEKICNDCDYSNTLSTPLELQEQEEGCVYTTLLSDTCNKCLNFDIRFPIKKAVMKEEKGGKRIYFTDNYNPPRFLDLNNLDQYNISQDVVCDEAAIPTCEEEKFKCEDCEDCKECLNCDRLLIFKKFSRPCINVKSVVHGGNLKQGVYSFLIAYCSKGGEEVSDYYSLTQNVKIFDSNNPIMEQPDLARVTNLAIKLELEDLDLAYNYFKIAVIQTADILGTQSYFIEGVHPISDTTVLYTSEDNKIRTSLALLGSKSHKWNTTEGMAVSNGYLYQYGLKAEPEWNLQKVVNLMSPFLRWHTGVASEKLYNDGALDALYGGYMRNEVYPFAIRFITDDGYETAIFPLVNRPATPDEITVIAANTDTASLLANAPTCDTDRTKYWQFYNTATASESECYADPESIFTGDEVEVSSIETCQTTPAPFVPIPPLAPTTYEFTPNDDYTTFLDYLNNPDNLLDYGSNPFLLAALAAAKVLTCCPSTYSDHCIKSWIDDDLSPKPLFTEILGETTTKIARDFPNYTTAEAPGICNIYKIDTTAGPTAGLKIEDAVFMPAYLNTAPSTTIKAYIRNPISNTTQTTAVPIIGQAIGGYYLNYLGGANIAALVTAIPSIAVSPQYEAFLHNNAIWFKVDLGSTATETILEITKRTLCDSPLLETEFNSNTIRVTIYNKATPTTITILNPPVLITDLDVGGFIELKRDTVSGASNIYYVAIDSEIKISPLGAPKHFLSPPCGCFGIISRAKEYSTIEIALTGVMIARECTYDVVCTYQIPSPDPCKVLPFLTGRFGYWESTENYPDNKELYDSSTLKINRDDLMEDLGETLLDMPLTTEFEAIFTVGVDPITKIYELNTDSTELYCTPIRHYKMPSNDIAPFMLTTPIMGMQESIIFPLGVRLEPKVIRAFLDIAVDNNIITLAQRNKITKYEILRGDRILDRGIIAKGLLYDTLKYVDEQGRTVHYPNYPYNTLGTDRLHYTNNANRNDDNYIIGNTDSGIRYTFHSPDTHFKTPTLPSEVEYEGYQYGSSIGMFKQVRNHPEYTLLGKPAYRLATTLAISEAVLEQTMIFTNSYLKYLDTWYTTAGPAGLGQNFAGMGTGGALMITLASLQALYTFAAKTGRYRYEWLNAFRANGNHKNFAYYYSSHGFYNYMEFDPIAHDKALIGNIVAGNIIKGIKEARYLKNGRYSILEGADDIKFNNVNRESSVYLSLGTGHSFTYGEQYRNFDVSAGSDSGTNSSRVSNCGNSGVEIHSNIASPYVSLKTYLPAQYGAIDRVHWINTSYCGRIDSTATCEIIWGGDIKISRMSLKRKMPLFTEDAMGMANQTPFAYSMYYNIGSTRFYADFHISDDENTLASTLFTNIFPDSGSNYNFNCDEDKFYLPAHNRNYFYLYYYGIPQFLVESEINLNFRYGGKTPEKWFYPAITADYVGWTQEIQTSIKEDNTYFYNLLTYAKNPIWDGGRKLTGDYSKSRWDVNYNMPNGVIASLQDINELSLADPWLSYRPNDFREFPKSYGKLIDLMPMESQTMAARFENQFTTHNTVDVLRERLNASNDAEAKEIGNILGVGIFAQSRPIEMASSMLGYMGTQHVTSLNTEFGQIIVDCKRGGIFMIQGGKMSDLSFESDVRQWLKEHLPFKLLQGKITGLTSLDVDNAFNGAGITLGWDDRTKRFLLTKKDYKLRAAYVGHVSYVDGRFSYIEDSIELTNPEYFEDASFTISYSFLSKSFASYHSYKPNYYISHVNYFSSGNNNAVDDSENGLWHHGLTNKSYQVFYGKKYPWTIEVSAKAVLAQGAASMITNRTVQAIEYWMESRRYHNNYDYAENREKGMTEAFVYNHNNNTGKLNLITAQKNNRQQSILYPITNVNSMDVLATQHEGRWSFNSIFNKIRDDLNNVPIFINDVNEIDKTINLKAVNYTQRWQDYLKGDWFLVRMSQNTTTQFQFIFKRLFNKNNINGGQ